MQKTLSLTIGLVIVVSILLSGCSGNSDEKASGSSSNDQTTITFWNSLAELEPMYKDFINDFEEEHPDIEVKMETLGETVNEQYQTAIKNEELPDVFNAPNVTSMENLVDQELVRNLDEIVTDNVKEQFDEGIWRENFSHIDNDIYALPINSGNSAIIMYYNKEVLERYNISEDEIPETWEELESIGKRIYEESDGNVYGLIMPADSASSWLNDLIVRQQASAITPSVQPSVEIARNINFNTGEPEVNIDGNIQTMKYFHKLMDEDVMSPASTDYDETTAIANFAAGKSAFLFDGNWAGTVLEDDKEGPEFENWGVAAMPTKNGDPYYSVKLSKGGLEVSEDTEHWDEVKTFLEAFIDYGYKDVIVKSGNSQPAIDVDLDEDELPFEQYNDINNLMDELVFPAPDIYKRNKNTIKFNQEYQENLTNSTGMILIGYLQDEVNDLEAELEKAQEEAEQSFEDSLNDNEDVKKEDLIFEDWEPLEPYDVD